MPASEKLTAETEGERLLRSKILGWINAGLLNENDARTFQFVLHKRGLKYSEYYKQGKEKLVANAISIYVMSHILHQSIAVLHSEGIWTSIMSDDINDSVTSCVCR